MNKGDVVTNREIQSEFGGSSQGGMRPSRTTNSLVLITGTAHSLYEDTWNNGLLKYTGTGRTGDQTMTGRTIEGVPQIDSAFVEQYDEYVQCTVAERDRLAHDEGAIGTIVPVAAQEPGLG